MCVVSGRDIFWNSIDRPRLCWYGHTIVRWSFSNSREKMAEASVETSASPRFFCHRCNDEIGRVLPVIYWSTLREKCSFAFNCLRGPQWWTYDGPSCVTPVVIYCFVKFQLYYWGVNGCFSFFYPKYACRVSSARAVTVASSRNWSCSRKIHSVMSPVMGMMWKWSLQ